MSTLQDTLKRLMDERRMGQPELARVSGVSQPVISRILSGISRDPRYATIQQLAKALGVTAEQLRGNLGAANADMDMQAQAALRETGQAAPPPAPGFMLQEVARALPPNLKQYVDAYDEVDNNRYKLNYMSPRLVADLGSARFFDGGPLATHDMYRTYVLKLWRLSSHRRLTQSLTRQYVLFINGEVRVQVELTRMLNQLTVEAAAHGIAVVTANLTQAVQYIIETENGTGTAHWADDD